MKCRDCNNFNRLPRPDETWRSGGHCKALYSALSLSQFGGVGREELHVYESFGCILWVKKEDK